MASEESADRIWIRRNAADRSQLIHQVLQGGGNMPAYGSTLSPQQTTALVRFLETLNGNEGERFAAQMIRAD